MSRTAAALALLALGAAVVVGCAPPETPFRGATYDTPEAAGEFSLTDHEGRTFRLADHRGKVLLLFFGFVHCPDVCPVTLSTLAKVQRALADAAGRVEFVFVTVDPERDTAERLAHHLSIFSDRFIGLTGSAEELQPVYDAFGVFHEKVSFSTSEAGYVVDHSTRIFVIDRQGRLRLRFPFDADAADIVHDVRRLLAEPGE